MFRTSLALLMLSINLGDSSELSILLQQFNEQYSNISNNAIDTQSKERIKWINILEDNLINNGNNKLAGEAWMTLGKLYIESGNTEKALNSFDKIIHSEETDATLKYFAAHKGLNLTMQAELAHGLVMSWFDKYAEYLPQVNVLPNDDSTKRSLRAEILSIKKTKASILEKIGALEESINTLEEYLSDIEQSDEVIDLNEELLFLHADIETTLLELTTKYLYLLERAEVDETLVKDINWFPRINLHLWRLFNDFKHYDLHIRNSFTRGMLPWDVASSLLDIYEKENGITEEYYQFATNIIRQVPDISDCIIFHFVFVFLEGKNEFIDPDLHQRINELTEQLIINKYSDTYKTKWMYQELQLQKLNFAITYNDSTKIKMLISDINSLQLSAVYAERFKVYQEKLLKTVSSGDSLSNLFKPFVEVIETQSKIANEQITQNERPKHTQSGVIPYSLLIICIGFLLVVIYLIVKFRIKANNTISNK